MSALNVSIDVSIIDASSDATEEPMRTTVTIDDELIDQAMALSGTRETSALLKQGLRALIEQESARRLARLGGTDPSASAAPRQRRPSAT
jgi:Arc/MetJ family transcription regulator